MYCDPSFTLVHSLKPGDSIQTPVQGFLPALPRAEPGRQIAAEAGESKILDFDSGILVIHSYDMRGGSSEEPEPVEVCSVTKSKVNISLTDLRIVIAMPNWTKELARGARISGLFSGDTKDVVLAGHVPLESLMSIHSAKRSPWSLMTLTALAALETGVIRRFEIGFRMKGRQLDGIFDKVVAAWKTRWQSLPMPDSAITAISETQPETGRASRLLPGQSRLVRTRVTRMIGDDNAINSGRPNILAESVSLT